MLETIIIVAATLISIDAALGIAAKIRRAKAEKKMAESAKQLTEGLLGALKDADKVHREMHEKAELEKASKKVATTKKPAKAKK